MAAHPLSPADVRAQFPAGTVLHNPVSGEYARVVEHTPERAVGELLAVPGGAVAGPHLHPRQEERFEVLYGRMGYRRGDEREGDARSARRGAAGRGLRRRDRLRAAPARGSARARPHGRPDRSPVRPVADARPDRRGDHPARALAGRGRATVPRVSRILALATVALAVAATADAARAAKP